MSQSLGNLNHTKKKKITAYSPPKITAYKKASADLNKTKEGSTDT